MQMCDYFKSLYEREQDIRHTYDDRIASTIAVTAAIVTSDIFLLNMGLQDDRSQFQILLFEISIVLLGALLALNLVLIFLSYGSFRYRYCDFPVDSVQIDINNKREELSASLSGHLLDEQLELYIEGMLQRTYNKCATIYYKENIRRRKFHHWLNVVSFFNIVDIIILFVILYL